MAVDQHLLAHRLPAAWLRDPVHHRGMRWIAYLLTLIGLSVVGYQFAEQWRRMLDLRPVDLHVYARVSEEGGWQVDTMRLPSGRDIHMTVHGVSGVHTFALAQTGVRLSQPIRPGEEAKLAFTAPAPGRYVLYCTTWCSANHWRMRTVIEVYDPADADAPLAFPQSTPRHAITVDAAMLDRPHLAEAWPAARPDAALGEALWAESAVDMSPADALAALDWPNSSPAAATVWLQEQGMKPAGLRDVEPEVARWAMVAYLWQQTTSPAELAQGQTLYQENCAACHGEQGAGDGFAAATSVGEEPDFTELRAAVGAPSALYYAKIARGGMGTGMPNWGTLLSEDELWALVAYIETFAFTPAPTVE